MKYNVILLIIGIIVANSCDAANLYRVFRTKRAGSDFILRSCMASAQLIRKHRTNEAELIPENPGIINVASTSPVSDNTNTNHFHNKNQMKNDLRLRTRSKGRHLIDKSTTDTPLGTVDVKSFHKDIPKVFKKKDPLPELDRNGTARKLDSDTPIIVVQPLNHRLNFNQVN